MRRTRFNISTNKKMTLSDLRNCLFSYLIAKSDGGEFIVRTLDTDLDLYNMDIEEFNYNVLRYMGISYDEGPKKGGDFAPYNANSRLNDYKEYAEKLVKKNKAYYCFCTKEELNKKRMQAYEKNEYFKYDGTCRYFPKDESRRKILLNESYVIRALFKEDGQTTFHDLVYKDVTIKNNVIEDEILIKSNGLPTYNFLDVLDNGLMNINVVTNDNSLIPSTSKAVMLYEYLNFPVPEFVHFPKLIEKSPDLLEDILNQGFLSKAIINYLVFLGWCPKNNKEFFSLDDLLREFKIEDMNKRNAHFDLKKLIWFNKRYMVSLSDEEYINFVRPFLNLYYNVSDKREEWINSLLLLYKNRLSFASEIGLRVRMFFTSIIDIDDEDRKYLVNYENVLNIFKQELSKINIWNEVEIKNVLDKVKSLANIENVYMPIRIVVTGSKCGVDLVKCLYLLEKETVLSRIDGYLQNI